MHHLRAPTTDTRVRTSRLVTRCPGQLHSSLQRVEPPELTDEPCPNASARPSSTASGNFGELDTERLLHHRGAHPAAERDALIRRDDEGVDQQ